MTSTEWNQQVNDLLQEAAGKLWTLQQQGEWYRDLTTDEIGDLGSLLMALVMAEGNYPEVDLGEAVELARRLIEDDEPENSPLWPTRWD